MIATTSPPHSNTASEDLIDVDLQASRILTGATLFSLAIVQVAWAQDYNEKPTAAEIAKLGWKAPN